MGQMKRLGFSALTLVLFALFLSGCTADTLLTQLETRPLLEGAEATAQEIPRANRLLILSTDGNIVTLNPDGSQRFALTTDASATKQYLQPTWSPDAQSIAYAELETTSGTPQSRLTTAAYDGTHQLVADVPFAPFYFFWSPDGNRLAYLSNWEQLNRPSLALRMADVAGAAETGQLNVTTLAEGQPFYFSWAPDSQRLMTHVGNARIELRSLEGGRTAIQDATGDFPTPQWSQDGMSLFYAIVDQGVQRLVATDARGSIIQDVTDFDDRIAFSLSPTDAQLAYVVSDVEVGMAALGPLYVTDLATLATREITLLPVIAFYWSPDGEKLAYVTAEPGRGTLEFHWNVWDGAASTDYGAFRPNAGFLSSYAPFFDQYAQSMDIWAPDSNAFAYAGSRDGRTGIWVQALVEEMPTMVSRGTFVTWSPN
ncbi:MAG: PD40 domain-containing protein [Caldilineaceae bacterium]|nr:PD40 domain-containing protein [Caldilineaceae bacterium]